MATADRRSGSRLPATKEAGGNPPKRCIAPPHLQAVHNAGGKGGQPKAAPLLLSHQHAALHLQACAQRQVNWEMGLVDERLGHTCLGHS